VCLSVCVHVCVLYLCVYLQSPPKNWCGRTNIKIFAPFVACSKTGKSKIRKSHMKFATESSHTRTYGERMSHVIGIHMGCQ